MYKEEKAIVGANIRRLTKFDEVTNHFLQTFVAHQMRVQGVVPAKDLGPTPASGMQTGKGPMMSMGIKSGGSIESVMQTVVGVMREMMVRNNKFVHKQDIYTMLSSS